MSERCMEKLLMLKMQALQIAEECIGHYAEDTTVFRAFAKKAHALYEEMNAALHSMKSRHEKTDQDMDKRYSEHDKRMHEMYHDYHARRAERIKRDITG